MNPTVDGRNPAPIGILSHYLQGFVPPRWCRVFSINSIHPVPHSQNYPLQTVQTE